MENQAVINEEPVSNEILIERLEAALFASGEPLSADKLADALETDMFTLQKLLNALELKLTTGGIELVKYDDRYQLVTKKHTADCVRRALEIRRNTPLSPAAFETLSVVAYRQPVTKAYVEQVRGVDCSASLAGLISKGLVEERGRLELPGRPLVYGTTDNFLRCFNLEDISQLPDLDALELEAGKKLTEDRDEDAEDLQLSMTQII